MTKLPGLIVGAVVLSVSVIGARADAGPVAKDCTPLLPSEAVVGNASARTVTPDDLVRLRDLGMPDDSLPDKAPFSISPDGKRIAFVLRRADPVANNYCHGLYVTDIRPTSHPRQIDGGGEFISYVIDNLRGMTFPSGIPAINTPKWSPDGRTVAYLKRLAGITQAWVVPIANGHPRQATQSAIDIEEVDWTPDGAALIVVSRPALARANADIEREGLSGYRYDRRFMPAAGYRPFPPGSIPREYFQVDLISGSVSPVPTPRATDRPRNASFVAASLAGRRAWIAPVELGRYLSESGIFMESGTEVLRCNDARCRGSLTGVWWSPNGGEIRYFRREGWGKSQFALYRWRPGEKTPRRAFVTEDVYSNCKEWRTYLVCDRDASLQPRRIVLLDPVSGNFRTIFDPNPEFARLKLGSVRRLQWRNANGVESFGDLVLPPDHRSGQRHPLIVVQYRTKGFLRGAVVDLYPIQSFAASGFAVLSVERPPGFAEWKAGPGDRRSSDEFERDNTKDWIDRRNVLSTILTGVEKVVSLGVADPSKVGISGTSEGAVSAWFALNNNSRFAAASIGSCCIDPKSFLLLGGPALSRQFLQYGYPPIAGHSPSFWQPISLAMNASSVSVPMLIQVPSDEFTLAIESFEALDMTHGRTHLYIFPDEHHYIAQPSHRLAIYRRNITWFLSHLRS